MRLLQGYGMTETCCAAGCITIPDYWPQYTTCGPVLPGAELRLESVPGVLNTAVEVHQETIVLSQHCTLFRHQHCRFLLLLLLLLVLLRCIL